MDIPTIETENFRLRPFIPDDLDDFYAILQGEDMLKYFPGSGKISREGAQKWLGMMIDHWGEYGYGLWALESPDGRYVGRCGLQMITETDEVEVDFIIGREFWGRGYATEAGIQALNFGFKTIGVDSIVGIVHRENGASQRVLEKIGMVNTGATEYFGIDVYRFEIKSSTFAKS